MKSFKLIQTEIMAMNRSGTAYSVEDRDDAFIPSDNWLCPFIKKERSKFIKYNIHHAHMEHGV